MEIDNPKFAMNFWAGIQPSDDKSCWPWMRSAVRGYGQTSLNTKTLKAHRVAFRLAFGRWPNIACHECDNPLCCNPKHIIDGTNKINTEDMLRKGRHRGPKGVTNGSCKLTEESVLMIRKEYQAGGTSYSKLARKFKCSLSMIGLIITKKNWTHI